MSLCPCSLMPPGFQDCFYLSDCPSEACLSLHQTTSRCEGAQSCDPAGCSLEDFTREVAACILQHYWRHALKRRNKQCNPCHEDESDVVCPASGLPPRNAMDRDKQANSSLSSTSGCSTGIRSLLAGPVQPRSPLSVRSDAAANSPGFTPPAGSLKFHQSSSPLGLASVSEGCGKDLVQDAGSESVGNSVLAEHANGHSAKATPGHGPIGRRHEARGVSRDNCRLWLLGKREKENHHKEDYERKKTKIFLGDINKCFNSMD